MKSDCKSHYTDLLRNSFSTNNRDIVFEKYRMFKEKKKKIFEFTGKDLFQKAFFVVLLIIFKFSFYALK